MSPAIQPTSASESTSSSTSLSSLSTHRRMQKFQRFQRFPSPEQRTRKDLVISALLGILSLCAAGGIWWNSDARITEHRINSNAPSFAPVDSSTLHVDSLPDTLSQQQSFPLSIPNLVSVHNAILSVSGTTARMVDISTGEELWRYDNDSVICGASDTWSTITLVFRTSRGCSEAISFQPDSGQYKRTRAALGSPNSRIFSSNNNIGLISSDRVEVWRSDLVREVEVGRDEAPAETGNQNYVECDFSSALVRKELLATAQLCPRRSDADTLVRLMTTNPEDSRKPEEHHVYEVPTGSQLVAIAQDRAIIYTPQPAFQILDTQGNFEVLPAQTSSAVTNLSGKDRVFTPLTADLPHNMTWWDGQRLIAFSPSTLQPLWSLEGAIGTGAAYGDRALIPVPEGIAVVDWSSGDVLRTINVNRTNKSGEAYTGSVVLSVKNGHIIEKRGGTIVTLQ